MLEEKKEEQNLEDIRKSDELKKQVTQPERKKRRSLFKKKIWFLFFGLLIFWIFGLKLRNIQEDVLLVPKDHAEKMDNYYGEIEGSLGYPSEFIPSMMVCAMESKTKEEYCTGQILEEDGFLYGLGYRLEVPAGNYRVFAQLTDQQGEISDDYKAYYSKFVTCGMEMNCQSHDPIEVKVSGGKVTGNIDPIDWYR